MDIGTYFKLKEEFSLCEWSDIRHGLLSRKSGKLVYLTDSASDAVALAWNGIPMDSPLMLPLYQNVLKTLVDNQIGEMTNEFHSPLPIQKGKKAACNFTEMVHWSITGRCNLKCRHCFVDAPDALYGELPLDRCTGIMDQMIDANIFRTSLTGGEPLVRRDFFDFYRELKKRDIAVERIYTNGLLITEKWLEQFKEIEPEKVGFSLSFDGIGHHDWLRGRAGMEQKALDAIRILTERGYPVDIESALFKDNLASMPETCRLLAALGVTAWKLSPMVTTGAWKQYSAEHSADDAAIIDCYLKILSCFEELGRPFSLQLGFCYNYNKSTGHAFPLIADCADQKSLDMPVCSCFRLHPYLLPNGTLMPCMPLSNCGLDSDMPNLLKTPLTECLRNGTSFGEFTAMTVNEMFQKHLSACSDCQYRIQCHGGCRACAHAHGNIYGPSPEMCAFFKGGLMKLFEPHYLK